MSDSEAKDIAEGSLPLGGLTSRRLASFRRPNPVYSDEYAVVRDVIADARLARGLSQRQLAALLGKCLSHVSLIERGQRRVDCLEWIRLGEILCDDPTALFRETRRRLATMKASEASAS